MSYFDDRGKPKTAAPKVALEDFQEDVAQWSAHNFEPRYPDMKAVVDMVILAEETGELARAIVKTHQGIRGSAEQWRVEAMKESGDIMVMLANIANSVGFSLTGALEERWAEVRQRDFKKDTIGHGMPDGGDDKDAIIARQKVELDALEYELMAMSVDPDYERGVMNGEDSAVRELRKILELPESVNPYQYLRQQKKGLLDG